MSDKIEYITLEEAIALTVGIDRELILYAPLEEMLEAFIETAEVDFSEAPSESHLVLNKIKISHQRAELARLMRTCIEAEIEATISGQDSDLSIKEENGTQLIDSDSLSYWSKIHFGINLDPHLKQPASKLTTSEFKWEDVRLSIRENNTIQLFIKKKFANSESYTALGLQGIKRNSPNHLYGILLGFSQGLKYPSQSRGPANRESKNINQISKILKDFAGLNERPFYDFQLDTGYKPKFQISDDTKAADKRAEDRSIHVPFDDNFDYSNHSSEQSDDADEFQEEHDKGQ